MKKLMCALALLVAAQACSDGDMTSPETKARYQASGAAARMASVRTAEDELAEIADSVPGFGGLFVFQNELRVYVTDTTRGSALRALLARSRVTANHREKSIRVLPGRFDFRDLVRWKSELENLIVDLAGVQAIGIDNEANSILVRTSEPSIEGEVRQAGRRLGLPDGALRVQNAAAPVVRAVYLNSDHLRPFSSGVSFGSAGTNIDGWASWGAGCSAGPIVWRINSPYSYVNVLTNSHCTPVLWEADFVQFYQSGISQTSFIGWEQEDPSYYLGGACPSGKACRYSETAMVTVEDTTAVRRGSIARTLSADSFLGTKEIGSAPNDAFTIQDGNDVTYPAQGEVADVVGSISGWTTGTVTDWCFDIPLPPVTSHKHFSYSPYMLCQFRTSAISRSGDSGGPVFRRLGTFDSAGREKAHLQGIMWGGEGTEYGPTYFSPMKGVQQDHCWTCNSGFTMVWGY